MRYTGVMEPPVVTLINKGGRPRKYGTPEEKKIAAAMARIARREAEAKVQRKVAEKLYPEPPVVPPAAAPADLNAAIAKAVEGLDIEDARFVTDVCGGVPYNDAYLRSHPAITAGSAKTGGLRKMAEPAVAAAMAEVRRALAATASYGFMEFMAEMDKAMVFAQRTNNATALVRAIELRGKATGSLSDRPVGAASTGFTLNIVGVDSPAIEVERIGD